MRIFDNDRLPWLDGDWRVCQVQAANGDVAYVVALRDKLRTVEAVVNGRPYYHRELNVAGGNASKSKRAHAA